MFVSGLGEQGRAAGPFPGAVTPTPTLLSHLLSITQSLGRGVEGARGGLWWAACPWWVLGLEEGLPTPGALS